VNLYTGTVIPFSSDFGASVPRIVEELNSGVSEPDHFAHEPIEICFRASDGEPLRPKVLDSAEQDELGIRLGTHARIVQLEHLRQFLSVLPEKNLPGLPYQRRVVLSLLNEYESCCGRKLTTGDARNSS
jgi:hypothetical protein